jgi:hypothetical protein
MPVALCVIFVFKLIFVFACKSNIFSAHMQVISSFLLILLENPPCPLNPLLSRIPYILPQLVSFPHLLTFSLLLFSKITMQTTKKGASHPHPLPPFYPPFLSLLTLLNPLTFSLSLYLFPIYSPPACSFFVNHNEKSKKRSKLL